MPLREEAHRDCLAVSHFASYSVFALVFAGEEEDLDDVVRKEFELFEKTLQDMIDFKKTHSKKLSLAEKTALASLKKKYLE